MFEQRMTTLSRSRSSSPRKRLPRALPFLSASTSRGRVHFTVGWRLLGVATILLGLSGTAVATTKGLSQIVTPDLEDPGDLSISFQAQSARIANPFQLQAEMGLTRWAEIAI